MSTARLVAHQIEKKWRSDDIKLGEDADFSSLCLAKPLLKGLKKAGFIRPSPIQLRAIPLGKVGLDLIVQAKSGTGKTCVFTVVALQSLCLNTKLTQVLIIVPTREIAYQICQVIKTIGVEYNELSCQIFIGGLPIEQDKKKLANCHIAVGTPGRIKQLIEMNIFKPQCIRLLVLDEADKLVMSNIKDDVNWIYTQLPENKQMITCSATYPEDLINWLQQYMRNPMCVRLDADKPALLGLVQFYQKISYHPQQHVMQSSKEKLLFKILGEVNFSQCLIFSNYQTHAETLYDQLKSQKWPVAFICGTQNQLHRLEIINKLKNFQCRILISTDLTARGIDAENVDLVINYEPPWEAETYLHRIGRAGRYGSYGISITLALEGVELERLLKIQHQAHLDLYKLPSELNGIWEHEPQQEDYILYENNSHQGQPLANVSQPNSSTIPESLDAIAKSTSDTLNSSDERSIESVHNSPNQDGHLDWAEIVDSNESSNGNKDIEESNVVQEPLDHLEIPEEDLNNSHIELDKEVDLSFLKNNPRLQNDCLTYYEAKEDLEEFIAETNTEVAKTRVETPNSTCSFKETQAISTFLQQELKKLALKIEEANQEKCSEERTDLVESQISFSIEKTEEIVSPKEDILLLDDSGAAITKSQSQLALVAPEKAILKSTREELEKAKQKTDLVDNVVMSESQIAGSVEATKEFAKEDNASPIENSLLLNGTDAAAATKSQSQPGLVAPEKAVLKYSREELLKYKDFRGNFNLSLFNEKFLNLNMMASGQNKHVLPKKEMSRVSMVKHPFFKKDFSLSFQKKEMPGEKTSEVKKQVPEESASQKSQMKDMIQEKIDATNILFNEKHVAENLQKEEISREKLSITDKVFCDKNGQSFQKTEISDEKLDMEEITLPKKNVPQIPQKKEEMPGKKLKVTEPASSQRDGLQKPHENKIDDEKLAVRPNKSIQQKSRKEAHPLYYFKPEFLRYKTASPIVVATPDIPLLPTPHISSCSSDPKLVLSTQSESDDEEKIEKPRERKSKFSISSRASNTRPSKASVHTIPTCSPCPHQHSTPHPGPPRPCHISSSYPCHMPSHSCDTSHQRQHHFCPSSPYNSFTWVNPSHCTSMPTITPCCNGTSHCSNSTSTLGSRPNFTRYCQLFQMYQHNFNKMKQWFKTIHTEGHGCQYQSWN